MSRPRWSRGLDTFVESTLRTVFTPNPTGLLAVVLTILLTRTIGGDLYCLD
jgi:hypothetical protein